MKTPFENVASLLDDVQHYFMNQLEGGITAHTDHPESWAYVGAKTEQTIAQLTFARSLFPSEKYPRFLECGAGLGFISMLAYNMGFDVRGIEISERYVALAKQMFPYSRTTQADIFAFDQYDQFDVIFYYGPFKDDAFAQAFEEKIETEAKQGCIFIGNRNVSQAWEHKPNFKLLQQLGIVGFIYQKLD